MSALLTVTFSALKGTALAVAIVNAAVLAAVLICLFLTGRKKETEPPKRTYFDPPAPASAQPAATEPAAEEPKAGPDAAQEPKTGPDAAQEPKTGPEAAQEPKTGPEAGGQESES